MAGLTYDGIPSTQTDSSFFSGTNLELAGSLISNRINNANGALFSASIGSPGAFGATIQAGSIATTAGSTATITFNRNFANAQYSMFLTPNALADGVGSVVPYLLSGTTTKTISGANIVGAASTQYNYVAVGLL